MRKLLIPCLIALAIPATAYTRTPPLPPGGNGTLSIREARGVVHLYARGSMTGRLNGRITITDPKPYDSKRAIVYGATKTIYRNEKTTVFQGKNLRFRAIGALFQVRAEGKAIFVSALARGRVTARRGRRREREHLLRRRLLAERRGVSTRSRTTRARSTWSPLLRDSGSLWHPEVVPLTTPQTVLVVEDEASIASFVSLYLKNAGYDVHVAETGEDALTKAEGHQPSLIVLDLMLPDIDGIEVCRRIRRRSEVPILMLTARDEDVDKIIGLEVGADDYLTKPFNPRELVARVKSILRRSTPDRKEVASAVLEHGDLHVDAGRREVKVGDEEIKLAPKEFDLLWELLDHRGLVLTRDQLLERVWGYTFAGDTRTVDVHVRQLRRKLGEASPIVTVWGVGYKVSPAKEAATA